MSKEVELVRLESHPSGRFLGSAVILIVAGILLTVIRSHASELPLETDECNYAYIGARLLEGQQLYTDVWDHQPPGIFMLFAAAMGLFGDSVLVFRCMGVAASLLSMVLVFSIVRRTAGLYGGYVAAFLFALLSADPGTAGEGCNREVFMNPMALAGVWLLVRQRRPALVLVALAGLCLGLGSLIKTVMAAQWLVLAVWLVVMIGQNAQTDRRLRTMVGSLLAFAAGPLVVWLSTWLYFSVTGRGTDFHEAVFAFNLGYSDTAPSYLQRFIDFFSRPVHRHVFDGTGSLWIAAGAAALALPFIPRSGKSSTPWIPVVYLLGSYWAVCLPGQFWPHYYYLMLPALIVVFASAVGALSSVARQRDHGRLCHWVAHVVTAAVFFSLLLAQTQEYFLVPSVQITEKRYKTRDVWAKAQAENVAKVTDPGDTVFVYGQDVGVYYYSKRRCASRYTMVGGLRKGAPDYQKRRAILLEELQTNRPRVVLIVDEQPYLALDTFLKENYFQVGLDYHDQRQEEVIMMALMDNSRPVVQIDWNWDRSSVYGID